MELTPWARAEPIPEAGMEAGRGWCWLWTRAGGGGGEELEGRPEASVLERRRPTLLPSPLPFTPALLAAPLASGPAAFLGLAAEDAFVSTGAALAAFAAAALSLASHENFSLALSARSTSDAWFL